MLTQSELEYERYESRRKALLDETTLRNEAQRVLEEGIEKGEKIGVIHLCERLLHRPATPKEQLTSLSLEELARLAEELQAQALKQGSAN